MRIDSLTTVCLILAFGGTFINSIMSDPFFDKKPLISIFFAYLFLYIIYHIIRDRMRCASKLEHAFTAVVYSGVATSVAALLFVLNPDHQMYIALAATLTITLLILNLLYVFNRLLIYSVGNLVQCFRKDKRKIRLDPEKFAEISGKRPLPDGYCPECGAKLLKKKQEGGPLKGTKYFVCSQYPECKHTCF